MLAQGLPARDAVSGLGAPHTPRWSGRHRRLDPRNGRPGAGALASLLGDGALLSGFLGFFVFVLLKVFQSLATFALVLWPLRLLRAISQHRLLLRRRLERVLSVLAVGL